MEERTRRLWETQQQHVEGWRGLFAAVADAIDASTEHGVDPDERDVRFIHADDTDDLELRDDSFDLLISLYGGFVSDYCTRSVRTGGHLLVDPSHGDAAMAGLDIFTYLFQRRVAHAS